MSSSESKAYWEAQTDSGHRFEDEEFYREKAEEHFYIMSADHRGCDCVDIGCGAGELLFHFSDFVNVRLGIDYSQSMLDTAKKKLIGKDISLINGDALKLLERLDVKVWIACQSINQYAGHNIQRRVLDVFVNNTHAEAIYLYDCVDPIRYRILKSGISYSPIKYKGFSWIKHRLYISVMTTLLAMKVLLGLNERPWQRVGGPAMGYGYLPKFWLEECSRRGLSARIASSRFYEYRYHVIISKNRPLPSTQDGPGPMDAETCRNRASLAGGWSADRARHPTATRWRLPSAAGLVAGGR